MDQRTPEWHAMRRNKIGASDAPVIMKKSPWKTPYQLWQEKLELVDGQTTNSAMQRGNDLEPVAKQALEAKLGMPLGPQIRLATARSWMMASLDAVSFDERTVAEIKCPGKADHETALAGHVPEKYYPQLQHQIEVCGVDMMYYFSYTGVDDVLLEVPRDDKYIAQLLIEEEKFYECMMNFDPPELMTGDYTWQDGAKWAKLVEELNEIKKLKKREEEIKEELIAIAEGKNARGAGITLTKCLRKGCIEYKKIPELANIDLEQYRKKASEFWRIT